MRDSLNIKYNMKKKIKLESAGFVYVYKPNGEMLFKFDHIYDAGIRLRISGGSMQKVIRNRVFNLRKTKMTKFDNELLKDCIFIRTKENISFPTPLYKVV